MRSSSRIRRTALEGSPKAGGMARSISIPSNRHVQQRKLSTACNGIGAHVRQQSPQRRDQGRLVAPDAQMSTAFQVLSYQAGLQAPRSQAKPERVEQQETSKRRKWDQAAAIGQHIGLPEQAADDQGRNDTKWRSR